LNISLKDLKKNRIDKGVDIMKGYFGIGVEHIKMIDKTRGGI